MAEVSGSQHLSEQEEEEQFARLTSDHNEGSKVSSRQGHQENQYRSAALHSLDSSQKLNGGSAL